MAVSSLGNPSFKPQLNPYVNRVAYGPSGQPKNNTRSQNQNNLQNSWQGNQQQGGGSSSFSDPRMNSLPQPHNYPTPPQYVFMNNPVPKVNKTQRQMVFDPNNETQNTKGSPVNNTGFNNQGFNSNQTTGSNGFYPANATGQGLNNNWNSNNTGSMVQRQSQGIYPSFGPNTNQTKSNQRFNQGGLKAPGPNNTPINRNPLKPNPPSPTGSTSGLTTNIGEIVGTRNVYQPPGQRLNQLA